MLKAEQLTERIIGLAINVHRALGPGLLESVYEQCLSLELRQAGLAVQRQVPIPVTYRGISLDHAFKADIVVDRTVILEIKSVAKVTPTHEAQVRTYLRFCDGTVGLLLNFNEARLIDGLRRFVR